MSTETTIYHLFGNGYSGRAVKLRELTPDDSDAVEAEARRANQETGHTDGFDYLRLLVRLALVRMIVAVTAPGLGAETSKIARDAAIKRVTEATMPELEKIRAGIIAGTSTGDALATRIAEMTAEAHGAGVQAANEAAANEVLMAPWISVNVLMLGDKDNANYFSKLFTVKDAKLLGVIYHRLYGAMEAEANEVMGKALKVSTG